MEYELYKQIKKGSRKTLKGLQDEELGWAYFVCCKMSGEPGTGASLLEKTWKDTVSGLVKSRDCPDGSFASLLSINIYKTFESKRLPCADDKFECEEMPCLDSDYDSFICEIDRLDQKEKVIYYLNVLGDLSYYELSELINISHTKAQKWLYEIGQKAHPQRKGTEYVEYMELSNSFKRSNTELFSDIYIPPLLISAIEHDYSDIYNTDFKPGKEDRQRKGPQQMKNVTQSAGKQASKKTSSKKKKVIVISVIACVVLLAIIISAVAFFKKAGKAASSISTTYTIKEVTVGNVSTTISGSGSLTPVTKETLTAVELLEELEEDADNEEDTTGTDSTGEQTESTDTTGTSLQSSSGQANGTSGTASGSSSGGYSGSIPDFSGSTATPPAVITGGKIGAVNVKVGDTVSEGDVIATIEFEAEEGEEAVSRNILAPYDSVLLEFYLREGEEISDSTSVAMFMGTDGYTMSISVDENNISLVALGQEVEIKIDSSSEEMPTGSVTDISYNGSTSGSNTYYQITVTFDYVAGTYPGMSVSAEIVIEDSGEGLLVPVSAVNTSGDTKYVYLAPKGSSLGETYEDGGIDVSKLTKITVTTGMSDGSYMIVESTGLSEGDLIVVISKTSTLTGSESSGNGSGGMSGFGGGGSFPGFGGGSFDFGDFDPSNMPSGFPGFGS